MKRLLLAVDRASTALGHLFAWLIIVLTALITWEVFSRYVLNNPHDWTLDGQIMLYGTLFMMAGAYTLAKNGHVRGDVLYGFFEPRTQAALDIPVAGFMLLMQGLVEIVRCIQCLQTGEWPSREADVEEVDVEKLKEMVKAEDVSTIAAPKAATPGAVS